MLSSALALSSAKKTSSNLKLTKIHRVYVRVSAEVSRNERGAKKRGVRGGAQEDLTAVFERDHLHGSFAVADDFEIFQI